MKKKLIIFDMDGTVNLEDKLIDGALDAFNYLKENNIRFLFFTNNSSHVLDFYQKRMSLLGIECNVEDNFYSSTEVMVDYLKHNHIHKIFVVGNKCFRDALSKDFFLVDQFDKNNQIDAVVAGFSTELVYVEIRDACLYLQNQDIPFLATNGDFRCPIKDGLFIPDCGSMCEVIKLCTGKSPLFLGKPNPEIIDFIGERYGATKEEMMVVGDRLYTDILIGVNAGIDSVCVLTGEATKEDIEKSDYKPTYVLDSVKDLPNLLRR